LHIQRYSAYNKWTREERDINHLIKTSAEDACLPYAPLKISRAKKVPAEGDLDV